MHARMTLLCVYFISVTHKILSDAIFILIVSFLVLMANCVCWRWMIVCTKKWKRRKTWRWQGSKPACTTTQPKSRATTYTSHPPCRGQWPPLLWVATCASRPPTALPFASEKCSRRSCSRAWNAISKKSSYLICDFSSPTNFVSVLATCFAFCACIFMA